jgi:cobalt-zinc-cadmium efflux system protein
MKLHHPTVHVEDHLNPDAGSSTRNLRLVFWLNFSFTVAEFVGGALTNSVAIQSDALHDLGDTLAIGLAWWLQRKSTQLPTSAFTFGFQRFSLLGALVNGLILLVGGGVVFWNALDRFMHPQPVHTEGMLGFAVAGVLLNGIAAWRAGRGSSMNEQVLSWHLLEDVLGWFAVGVVSIVLMARPEWTWLDPALSVAITGLVVYNVVRRLAKTLRVFLQGLPEGMDLDAIQEAIGKVPGVASIHACRVWSLDGERHVFSAHVTLEGVREIGDIVVAKSRIYTALDPWCFYDITLETEFVYKKIRPD